VEQNKNRTSQTAGRKGRGPHVTERRGGCPVGRSHAGSAGVDGNEDDMKQVMRVDRYWQ